MELNNKPKRAKAWCVCVCELHDFKEKQYNCGRMMAQIYTIFSHGDNNIKRCTKSRQEV